MVGKLLYLSNERPDAQAVIQYLAGKSSSPTEQALKILRHLAGYIYNTRDYGVNVKNYPASPSCAATIWTTTLLGPR